MRQVMPCPHEPAILAAVAKAALSDEQRAHLASCESCSEAVLVSHFLHEAASSADCAVPDAGLVWWKAQLRLKRERSESAMKPVAVAEKLSAGVLIGAVGIGAALLTPTFGIAAIALTAGVALLGGAGSILYWAASRK